MHSTDGRDGAARAADTTAAAGNPARSDRRADATGLGGDGAAVRVQ